MLITTVHLHYTCTYILPIHVTCVESYSNLNTLTQTEGQKIEINYAFILHVTQCVCTHRCSYDTTSFKNNDSMLLYTHDYIYVLKGSFQGH